MKNFQWFSFLLVLFVPALAQKGDEPTRVLQIIPAPNATGVSVNTTIDILFSELMEPPRSGYSTVDPPLSPLYEQGSQTPVPGTLTSVGQGDRWVFRPQGALKYNTVYEVRLNGWLSFRWRRDQSGRIGVSEDQLIFRFTTEPEPDRTPPRVVRVLPSDKQANVPIQQEIEIEFSEPVNPPGSGSTAGQFFESPLSLGGQPVAGTLTSNQARTQWRFRPSQPLRYASRYTIDVSRWSDNAKNGVQPPHSFSFETEPEPDRTPPRVVHFFPANGEQNVPTDVTIEVDFSESVRLPQAIGTILFEGQNAVPGSLRLEGARLLFRPSQPLKSGTVYRIQVDRVTDEAGNAIAPPYESSFTTFMPPPSLVPFRLVRSSIPDGAVNVPRQPRIELEFNLPLVQESIRPLLRSERAQFPLSIERLAPNRLVLLPQTPLPGSTRITLEFGSFRGVGSEGQPTPSQLAFTTEIEVDRTPPRVISSNPQHDARNVPIQPVIMVNFDERVRPTGVGNRVVRDAQSGQYLVGTLTLQPDGRTFVFQLQRPLSPQTVYEIVLEGWSDEAGNPVAEGDRILRFTTGSGVARQVQLLEPSPGAPLSAERSPRFRWVPQQEVLGYILVITASSLSPRSSFERVALRGPERDPFATEDEAIARLEISVGATGEVEIPLNLWQRVARYRNAQLYWTVRARTAEGQRGGDEATQSESRPFVLGTPTRLRLLSPEPNAIVSDLLPTFRWQGEGSIPTYRFSVRTAQGEVVYQAELRETALTYDELAPQPLRNNQQYLWQVEALDNTGKTIAESETRPFRTPAQKVEPITLLAPNPTRSLRSRLPYFVWEPTRVSVEQFRLVVFREGSDAPLFSRELSQDEARTLELPADLRFASTVLRAFYPDDAPRLDPNIRYTWRLEGYTGDQMVASSERVAFGFIEDRYIPVLVLQDLQVLVNGASVPTYPLRGSQALFVKPGDTVTIRGRVENRGEGVAVDVPVQLVADSEARSLDLLDRIQPIPQPRRLTPEPPTRPQMSPPGRRSEADTQEGDYGDLVEQQQSVSPSLQNAVPLQGFTIAPELGAVVSELIFRGVRIARIEPNGSADFELSYTVPPSITNGKSIPVVALVGEGATAVKQGCSLFNVFGFHFEPTTPASYQDSGGKLLVEGRIRWNRSDAMPMDPSPQISIPVVATLAPAQVVEARLTQETSITLYRFEGILLGAVTTSERRLDVRGSLIVPLRGGGTIAVPFGKRIAMAVPLAPSALSNTHENEEYGGGSADWQINLSGGITNNNSFGVTNRPLFNREASPFDTQAFAPNVSLPISEIELNFPPLVLDPSGNIVEGEINISAPSGKRLSIQLNYDSPTIVLEPQTVRLSRAGMRVDGFSREYYLPHFGYSPGSSGASALVISFQPKQGGSKSFFYSAQELVSIAVPWWEQIETVYPTFVAFNWWREGDQRFWTTNDTLGYANLGGYIPTNLNFAVNEWFPDIFRVELPRSFVSGTEVMSIANLQNERSPAERRMVGAERTTMLAGRTQSRSSSLGVEELDLSRFAIPTVETPRSLQIDYNLGAVLGNVISSLQRGNNVNPSSVPMSNLPLVFREVVLSPTRRIQAGEIRLVYDLGVVDSAGFRANRKRMRAVTVDDVGGQFYVGDFQFQYSSNPGWSFELPGGVRVEVDVSGLSFAPEDLADGKRWRAIGGRITPRLPSEGLRYNFAGMSFVLTQIQFDLSVSEQKVKLEGFIELPEAFTQAMDSAERGRVLFRDVQITSSGSLNGNVSLEGVGFNLGMFRIQGVAGSILEIQKSASAASVGVQLRNLNLQLPNPIGGNYSTLNVENLTVGTNGIQGTVSFNTPITVGEDGFGFSLNSGAIVFNNTQVSVNVGDLVFHLPSVSSGSSDSITLRDLALNLADPNQWQFYFPLEGTQIGTIDLSDSPAVRLTVPDEAGADLVIDLSATESPSGKPPEWRGIWLRKVRVQIGNEEGTLLSFTGEGLEVSASGFTGTLSSSLDSPFDWSIGGFQIQFQSVQARFENNSLAELTIPNAQLSLPGIGTIPLQDLVARSGSPLRLISGAISGTHTVQLFGMPLTIQNAGFTESGFRIESASLQIAPDRTVSVNNLLVDGHGHLSGSLSFTGPLTFNLVDTGAYQVEVRLDSAELGDGGLRVNGAVRIPIPEPLRPLKPETWPDVLEANFSNVVFTAEPRIVSGRIAFTVGSEEIGSIDSAGVHLNIASALPAIGENLQIGPFTVRIESLTATNFLDVSGQARLILPEGLPLTPNEILFSFEHLQLAQEGGGWRVGLGKLEIKSPSPEGALRLSLPGGFAVAVKQLTLAPQASDCKFDFWIELPSGVPITVADSGTRVLGEYSAQSLPRAVRIASSGDPVRLLLGMAGFSPDFTLYFDNIELPDLNLPGGMRAEQVRGVIDFTSSRSPAGRSNDWVGVLIESGRLRLPASMGADRAVNFSNLAIGSDGLSGELSLSMDPPLQIGGESSGGFTMRFTSGQLRFLPAPQFAEISASGELSFPRSLAPDGSSISLTTQIRFTGGVPRVYAEVSWSGEIPLTAGMRLRSASGVTTITLDFDPDYPDTDPARTFMGVKISEGSITLPEPFQEGECAFSNIEIGTSGFSGTLSLRAPFSYAIPFGDQEFRIEFQSGSITLTNSRITNATLNGSLTFPDVFERIASGNDGTRATIASDVPMLPQSNRVSVPIENLSIDLTGGSAQIGLILTRVSLPPVRFAGFELDFGSGDTGGVGIDLSPNGGIEGFTNEAFMGVVLYSGAFRTPPLIGDQRLAFAFSRLIIGTSGLSGSVSLENPINIDLPFVQGAQLQVSTGGITFDRNRVTDFSLGGGLVLPSEFRLADGSAVTVSFDALRISMTGEFSIEGVRLPPVQVGGFTVSANEIAIDASRSWTPNNSLGLPTDWRGIYILGGRVQFPTSLYTDSAGNPLTIEIFSAIIGDTGKISADVRLTTEVRFDLRGANGMAIGLTQARAVIEDNTWKQASFSGYIQLPSNVENVASPGSPVRLTFHNASFKANGEFFVEVSLDRCRIYGFEVAINRLTFDYDSERAPTIQVPTLLDDSPRNTVWKGVYVEGGFLKLPPSLAREGAEPPSVRVEHLFVDGNGITTRAVFDAGGNLSGEIVGFSFDLREFGLGIRRNSIVEGRAVIGVGIQPITRPNEKIRLTIHFAESGFTVTVQGVPTINIQEVAILTLRSVTFSTEDGGKLLVSGSLNFRPLNATADFTNLGISSRGFEGEIWIVPTNPLNASFQGFGVALREVGLGTRNGRFFIGVGGDLTITVSDLSITGGTRLAFFIDGGVDIDRIAVGFTWKDFVAVEGEFQFTHSGNLYDFYGRMMVHLKMGGGAVGIEAEVRVGRTTNFGYFGFSAVVTIPTPIQLGSLPLALYELGGGLAINLSYTPGQSITRGTPTNNAFIFQATVGICTTDRYLLHGRIRLTVALAGSTLSSISLDGRFYLLSSLTEQPNDRWVEGIVAYNHPQKRFSASLNVNLAISAGERRIVQVTGGASLVISPSEFLISVGTPSQRVVARVLDFINLDGYLLFGVEGGRFKIETALRGSYDFGIASASLEVAFWFRTNPFEIGGCIGASASLLGIGVNGQGCISCCPVRIKLELCVSLLFDDACIGFEI